MEQKSHRSHNKRADKDIKLNLVLFKQFLHENKVSFTIKSLI